MNILLFLLVGVVAGFCAGKLVKGRGFGILMDMMVGVVGAVIGGFVFASLGLAAYGLVGSLVVSIVGAVLLLLIVRFFGGRKSLPPAH